MVVITGAVVDDVASVIAVGLVVGDVLDVLEVIMGNKLSCP